MPPYRLRLVLPLSPMNTAATRAHRMTQYRAAESQREAVVLMVGTRRPKEPLPRARVVCTRHSTTEPDHENLALGFKAIIDALMPTTKRKTKKGVRVIHRAGVIEDDGPKNLEREYRWEKAPPRKGFLEIVVTELAA